MSILIHRVELLSLSSDECEREFSMMNLNADPVRSQLPIHTLSSLTFIQVNGPIPINYKTDHYVQQWLQGLFRTVFFVGGGNKIPRQFQFFPYN